MKLILFLALLKLIDYKPLLTIKIKIVKISFHYKSSFDTKLAYKMKEIDLELNSSIEELYRSRDSQITKIDDYGITII